MPTLICFGFQGCWEQDDNNNNKKIYNTQPYKSLYKLTLEMEPTYLTKSDIQLNPYLENKKW